MSLPQAADAAILIESIAHAAGVLAGVNPEAARRLTRFATVVLPVSARVAREWHVGDFTCAETFAASEALHAVRAMSR